MTSCPDFDRLARAAAQSDRAARRLDAHVATCPACTAEAVLADDAPDADLAAWLAPLADDACPPEIMAHALHAARQPRAADRPADRPAVARVARPAPRWRAGVWALPLLVLLAAAWVMNVLRERDAAAPVATASPAVPSEAAPTVERPEAPSATPQPLLAARDGAATRAPAPDDDASSRPAAAPAERFAERRPAPAAPTPPAPEATLAGSDADPLIQPLAAATPTAADSAEARDGLRLALAVVGRARQDAMGALGPELRRPQAALSRTLSNS